MKILSPKSVIYLFVLGLLAAAVSFYSAANVYVAWLYRPAVICGSVAAMICCLALGRWVCRMMTGMLFAGAQGIAPKAPEEQNSEPCCPRPIPASIKHADPGDVDGLVEQMLAQDRFALLLRPQIACNLSDEQFARTLRILGERMALVPDGEVQLEEGDSARVAAVERFFLDRYLVTNRQYYEFVAAGGYLEPALWDEAVLPGVLEFTDCTGNPGPRYWRDGCFAMGEDKHPVVGISWYEAAAYARWVGKRLPSDPEWVKAGAWPVRISSTNQVQRKYPWGDSMDRFRANLWGSGPGHTVPVDQFPGGVSAGGVHQLIGNVWEWTTSNYTGSSLPPDYLPPSGLRLDVSLKSIHGGAFDTYFDNQAACQFQSGENPLSRRTNIGFRCAVGVCDLLLVRPALESAGCGQ